MQEYLLFSFDHNRLTSGGVWPYNRGDEIGTENGRGGGMSELEREQMRDKFFDKWVLGHREKAARSRVFPRDRNGQYTTIPAMSYVHVWRGDYRVHMIVGREGSLSPAFVTLSEPEMDMIMSWAWRMVAKGKGSFTPSDGGWTWWAR